MSHSQRSFQMLLESLPESGFRLLEASPFLGWKKSVESLKNDQAPCFDSANLIYAFFLYQRLREACPFIDLFASLKECCYHEREHPRNLVCCPARMTMSDIIDEISSLIKHSNYVVAFTGAGISAECGIPTYRGTDGLWKKYDPNLYANISYFLQDPSYYWNFFREVRYPLLKKAKPSKGHLALAEMEDLGILKTIITQNIDGLHQEAGSSSVFELHGTTRIIFCMNCSHEYSMDEAYALLEVGCPPLCAECQGNLRPAVVFFGEALDPQILGAAFQEAEKCDFLLIVGSSSVVHPAAEIPMVVRQKQATLAIINKERTALDHLADAVIHEEAGRILPQIVQNLKK